MSDDESEDLELEVEELRLDAEEAERSYDTNVDREAFLGSQVEEEALEMFTGTLELGELEDE